MCQAWRYRVDKTAKTLTLGELENHQRKEQPKTQLFREPSAVKDVKGDQ